MSMDPSRRSLLKRSGAVFGASVITTQVGDASLLPLRGTILVSAAGSAFVE